MSHARDAPTRHTSVVEFTTTALPRPRGGIVIDLPFDPEVEWGDKGRHDVAGTIGGYPVRGRLASTGGGWTLPLGPAWCRDPRVGAGASVAVVLRPEGPQLDTVAPDVAAALIEEPDALRQFESLATFYRNGYIDWIEAAKRPETREKRIAGAIGGLKAGKRQP